MAFAIQLNIFWLTWLFLSAHSKTFSTNSNGSVTFVAPLASMPVGVGHSVSYQDLHEVSLLPVSTMSNDHAASHIGIYARRSLGPRDIHGAHIDLHRHRRDDVPAPTCPAAPMARKIGYYQA